MSLVVSAPPNSNDMRTIANWLQLICSGVLVDFQTGVATPGPSDWKGEGCECLRAIMEDKNHTVRIHPLSCPKDPVPGSDTLPGSTQKTIGSCDGGCCVPSNYGNASNTDANDSVHGAGSDADVYIDMSDNHGAGYSVDVNYGGGVTGEKARPFVILAHELTTGHAYHCINGTLPHPTGVKKVDEHNREAQAIESENRFRKQQNPKMHPRVMTASPHGG